jgi:hypothetical protein
MKTMFAMIENKQKAKQTMADMVMADGSAMPAGSM